MTIKVGDRVRVLEGCHSATPGTIFVVTRITERNNPFNAEPFSSQYEYRGFPDWYAMGALDSAGRNGVWGQFLEVMPDFDGAVDQLMFDYAEATGDSYDRVKAGLTFAYEHGWGGVS